MNTQQELPPEKQRSKYKLKKLDSAVKKDKNKYKVADNRGESSNNSSSSEVIEGEDGELVYFV